MIIQNNDILFYPKLGLITKTAIKESIYELLIKRIRPFKKVPLVGVIFISNTTCNLSCKYCYSRTFGQKDMPITMATNYIDYLIISGNRNLVINFFGGEPTLRPEFIKKVFLFLSRKDKINIYLRINTNGTLDENLLRWLIEKRFKIIISSDGKPGLDGGNRGRKDYFSKVEKSIITLAKSDALFRVRCTITNNNIHNLHQAIDYWHELGVKFINFEPVNPYDKKLNATELVPNKIEYVKILKELVLHGEEKGIWIISSPFSNLLSPTTSYCTTCSGQYVVITPEGLITSCLRVQGPSNTLDKFIIGEFKNGMELLKTAKIHELRKISVDNSSHCKYCKIRYICGGGCPMRNYLHTGDLMKPDPWECFVKRNLINWAVNRFYEYVNGSRFPSILGQHVFEKLAFSSPSFGKPIFEREKNKTIVQQKWQENEKDIMPESYFIYQTVGTSKQEFLSLKRLSRCECF